jgi:hypothetical protein
VLHLVEEELGLLDLVAVDGALYVGVEGHYVRERLLLLVHLVHQTLSLLQVARPNVPLHQNRKHHCVLQVHFATQDLLRHLNLTVANQLLDQTDQLLLFKFTETRTTLFTRLLFRTLIRFIFFLIHFHYLFRFTLLYFPPFSHYVAYQQKKQSIQFYRMFLYNHTTMHHNKYLLYLYIHI